MSDIVIASVPIHGHVMPLLAVARGLVERGHRVRMLTGARFGGAVAATGAEFVALPSEADFDDREIVSDAPDRPSGIRGLRHDVREVFLKPAGAQYRALRELAAEPTDAVIVDPAFIGGPFLAALPRSRRPPVVVAGMLPLTLPSSAVAPFGLGLAPLRAQGLNRVRNAVLRRLVHRVVFGPVQAEADATFRELHGRPLGTFVLDLATTVDAVAQFSVPAFEYPRPDATVPVHFVGPVTPATDLAVPDWWEDLQGPQPVVLVTQGTIANRDLGELVLPTVEALAGEDVLVVVTTGGPPVERLGSLPGNVRAARYLPYDRLFPHVDAMVTNGGYGGVHYALAHGVPMVVAGAGEDKPEVAARVAWSGTGLDLRTGHPKPRAVRRAVRRVLRDGRYRAAASAIARDIAAAPGLDGLERLVASLASGRERGPGVAAVASRG